MSMKSEHLMFNLQGAFIARREGVMNEPIVKKGNFDSSSWKTYRKKRLTKARRMVGPFIVQTLEGQLRCKDGYLAEDSMGNPYPIDKAEFLNIYVEDK